MKKPYQKKLSSLLNVVKQLIKIPEEYFVNSAVIIVLVSFLFTISGCNYYKVITKNASGQENLLIDLLNDSYHPYFYPRETYTEDNLVKMLFQEHNIYLVDSTGKWLLENPVLRNDTLICKSTYEPRTADSIVTAENREHKRYYPKTESEIINRINLHVTTINHYDSALVYIPLSSIYQYDIYNRNVWKTYFRPACIVAGTGLLIAVIVGISSINNMSIY
jgi:hypothetical protein